MLSEICLLFAQFIDRSGGTGVESYRLLRMRNVHILRDISIFLDLRHDTKASFAIDSIPCRKREKGGERERERESNRWEA